MTATYMVGPTFSCCTFCYAPICCATNDPSSQPPMSSSISVTLISIQIISLSSASPACFENLLPQRRRLIAHGRNPWEDARISEDVSKHCHGLLQGFATIRKDSRPDPHEANLTLSFPPSGQILLGILSVQQLVAP